MGRKQTRATCFSKSARNLTMPLPPPIESAIGQIATDNRSGAAEILSRAAQVLSMLYSTQLESHTASIEQARRLVAETCAAIVQAQPDMAPLVNLANTAMRAANRAKSADEVLKLAARSSEEFSAAAAQRAASASLVAASLITEGAVVLTHSRSSTVLAAFTEAWRAGRRFGVIATESRPILEGRVLAQALARQGVSVTLIADAAAAAVIDRVAFVLVGADKITPGYLINKIGTRMITLAARERNLPAYCICDTSKFINREGSSTDEHAASELWPDAPAGIVVLNRYFEPTPLSYFTKIITEDGMISPEEASRRAEANTMDQSLTDAIKRRAPL
jgi:translation initiation factor 2B subunit (eIF-2B alpha/beta/delta family)